MSDKFDADVWSQLMLDQLVKVIENATGKHPLDCSAEEQQAGLDAVFGKNKLIVRQQ